MEGIDSILQERGVEHTLVGHPAMFSFILGLSKPPREYREVLDADMELYEHLQALMREKGIEYEHDPKEPWFLCEAHTDADIDLTLSAFNDSLAEVLK